MSGLTLRAVLFASLAEVGCATLPPQQTTSLCPTTTVAAPTPPVTTVTAPETPPFFAYSTERHVTFRDGVTADGIYRGLHGGSPFRPFTDLMGAGIEHVDGNIIHAEGDLHGLSVGARVCYRIRTTLERDNNSTGFAISFALEGDQTDLENAGCLVFDQLDVRLRFDPQGDNRYTMRFSTTERLRQRSVPPELPTAEHRFSLITLARGEARNRTELNLSHFTSLLQNICEPSPWLMPR